MDNIKKEKEIEKVIKDNNSNKAKVVAKVISDATFREAYKKLMKNPILLRELEKLANL
jgi:DTW domain-containing protein YfiP